MSKLKDKQYLPKQLTTTGAEPTVPSSDYRSDGSWLATDTEKGQITINLVDDKIWYRTNNGQVEILNTDNGSTKILEIDTQNYSLNESTEWLEFIAHVILTGTTVRLATAQVSRDTLITIKNTTNSATLVQTQGGETIDGESQQTIYQWDSITLYPFGGNWYLK